MAQHAKGIKWYIIIAFVITWGVLALVGWAVLAAILALTGQVKPRE